MSLLRLRFGAVDMQLQEEVYGILHEDRAKLAELIIEVLYNKHL